VLGPVEANLPSGAPLAPTALPIMNDIPFYDTTTNHQEITEWLAIGDSFSAGISADKQSDMLNSACSRFKMSYPNQMQNNPRFPGHSTSRDFTFGACSGGKMADVVSNQIGLGKPDGNANYPKIGNPQVVTLSISGNDLGFGDVRTISISEELEANIIADSQQLYLPLVWLPRKFYSLFRNT